jgi:hypothetical protein
VPISCRGIKPRRYSHTPCAWLVAASFVIHNRDDTQTSRYQGRDAE